MLYFLGSITEPWSLKFERRVRLKLSPKPCRRPEAGAQLDGVGRGVQPGGHAHGVLQRRQGAQAVELRRIRTYAPALEAVLCELIGEPVKSTGKPALRKAQARGLGLVKSGLRHGTAAVSRLHRSFTGIDLENAAGPMAPRLF